MIKVLSRKLFLFAALFVGLGLTLSLSHVYIAHAQSMSSSTNYSSAMSQSSCTTLGGEWCPPMMGGVSWCSAPGMCPITTQSACEAAGRKWCVWGGMGGCSMAGMECMSGGSTAPPPTGSTVSTPSTSGATPAQTTAPTSASTTPVSQSYWTATTATDCQTRGGEWCSNTSGGVAWCATVGTCPINDKASCEALNRKWCTSSFGGGGCSAPGYDCGGAVSNTQPTPSSSAGAFAWPTTKSGCENYYGAWCESTGSGMTTSGGACQMGNTSCPNPIKPGYTACRDNSQTSQPGSCAPMPTTELDCGKQGRNWCKMQTTGGATGSTNSGWCSVQPCMAMPPSGMMTCPDGKSFSATMAGCPSKTPTTSPTDLTQKTQPTTETSTPVAEKVETFAWPKSQEECALYTGKWCGAAFAGWCTMAHLTCPPTIKPGFMMCWDKSVVTTSSVCPAMPMTEIACGQAAKFWCNYNILQNGSAQSGGWCSGEPCPPAPTTGKMTCPDGRTYATTLVGCPHKAVEEIYTMCLDGTKVAKGAQCSAIFQCKTGELVADSNKCPAEAKNPIDECLTSGGAWCPDSTGSKTGYCGKIGAVCRIKPQEITKPYDLTDKEAKLVTKQTSSLISTLKRLRTSFARAKDVASLEKVGAVEKTLAALPKDSAALSALSDVQDAVDALSALATNLDKTKGTEQTPEMDAQALKQMKTGIQRFIKSITDRSTRIAALQKQGVVIDPATLDLVKLAQTLSASVANATNYSDARDAMEQLPDVTQNLNDAFQKIEVAQRLKRVSKLVDKKAAEATRTIIAGLKLIDIRHLDSSYRTTLVSLQANITAAALAVKVGQIPDDQDPNDFIQTEIFDKIDDATTLVAHIRAVSSLKSFVQATLTRMSQYDRKLTQLKRANPDTAEAEAALLGLKNEVVKLKTLAAQTIDEKNIDAVIDQLDAVQTAEDLVRESLGITSADAVKKQIEQSLSGGTQSIKQLQVNDVEQLIVRANRFASLQTAKSKARSHNFAIDF